VVEKLNEGGLAREEAPAELTSQHARDFVEDLRMTSGEISRKVRKIVSV